MAGYATAGTSIYGTTATLQTLTGGDITGAKMTLHVGANTGDRIEMDVYSFVFSKLAEAAGLDDTAVALTKGFFLSTQNDANAAIESIDQMISVVDSQRADLGAIQNRLESSNQSNVSANSADARSRIRDADFAEESANLSQQSIIQQAATSMLMQANTRPQLALSMLG